MFIIQITTTYFFNVIYFIWYNIEEEYFGKIFKTLCIFLQNIYPE